MYFSFFNWDAYASGDEKLLGKTLNKKKLDVLPIMLPPLPIQHEIVARLEKELAKVDEMTDAFKRMAKLADEEFKAVLSETFEHVEGKCVKLGDVCDCCLGKMLDKSKNKGKLHRYLRNVNVRWGAFDLEDVLEMRFEDDEHERYGLKNGDIVMCEGGEPGRCAIWREEEPGMLFQKALHRIRPSKAFLSEYLYFLFMSYSYNGIFHERFVGTTIYHLTGQVLKELPVTVCSIDNQQMIISNLSLAETHKNSLKTESEHGLSLRMELRKSILQEAFA
jgi:restriction endonuclease S subunit